MNKRKGILVALVFGLLLIGLSIVLFIERLLDTSILTYWWPLVLVAFGAAFILGLLMAPKGWAVLAIPGSVLITLGLILFYQLWFNLWGTWTYIWALLIVAFGVGIWIFNIQIKDRWLGIVGSILTGAGLLKYLLFGFIFEKLLHISESRIQATFLYIAIIVLTGVWIILTPWMFGKRKPKPAPELSKPGSPPTTISD